MRLYSKSDIASILGVTKEAVLQRIKVRGLKPVKIENYVPYYSYEQVKDIVNARKKAIKNHEPETIYITQTFWIIESKMNYER